MCFRPCPDTMQDIPFVQSFFAARRIEASALHVKISEHGHANPLADVG